MPPRWALEALEPLVLISAARVGPRARVLLDGLLAPLATAAGTQLAELEGEDTPALHARWAHAFRPERGRDRGAEDVPGRLGDLVRARLAGQVPVLAAVESPAPAWVRWANRLVLELQGSDCPRRPSTQRLVPSSGREGKSPGGSLLARLSHRDSRPCSPSLVRPGRSRSIGG